MRTVLNTRSIRKEEDHCPQAEHKVSPRWPGLSNKTALQLLRGVRWRPYVFLRILALKQQDGVRSILTCGTPVIPYFKK